jgi:hypothetical protein
MAPQLGCGFGSQHGLQSEDLPSELYPEGQLVVWLQ